MIIGKNKAIVGIDGLPPNAIHKSRGEHVNGFGHIIGGYGRAGNIMSFHKVLYAGPKVDNNESVIMDGF